MRKTSFGIAVLPAVGLLSLMGCGSDGSALRCGPGTYDEGGQCVPVDGRDAGDGAVPSGDGATEDALGDEVDNRAPCEKSGHCPTVEMVTVPWSDPNKPTYQMDAYETTLAEYNVFLKDVENGYVPDATDEMCVVNESYAQDAECVQYWSEHWSDWMSSDPKPQEPTWPVTCLDWCDARSYCEWAGKRLCRHNDDLSQSEWYNACSEQGNDVAGEGPFHAKECALPKSCEDAPGLYNMTWGREEWLDSCWEYLADGEMVCSVNGSDGNLVGGFCDDFQPAYAHNAGLATIRCCQ